MTPSLIKSVKAAALDRDTTAFVIIEQAVRLWFETEGGLKTGRNDRKKVLVEGGESSRPSPRKQVDAQVVEPADLPKPEHRRAPTSPPASPLPRRPKRSSTRSESA